MSPKKIDRPHNWSWSCPTQCLCCRPSWVTPVTGHYLSTIWPFLGYSTSSYCSAFCCNLRWRVFLYFRCLTASIQGRGKEGKGEGSWERWKGAIIRTFPLPLPIYACHAGYTPSQYFQWCIPWYILQANSHIMWWLFWQLLKQSGWNFPVFPYYALPSKDPIISYQQILL